MFGRVQKAGVLCVTPWHKSLHQLMQAAPRSAPDAAQAHALTVLLAVDTVIALTPLAFACLARLQLEQQVCDY